MSETIQRYPIQWPAGWRRTEPHARERAKFGKSVPQYRTKFVNGLAAGTEHSYNSKESLTIADAISRVLGVLQRMGVDEDDIVISSNLRTRLDGLPVSGQAQPADPGACVYWRSGAGTRCMGVDRYDRVQDNLAAIAATLDAMRAIERHGGATILDRAFAGFVALPAPRAWWQVLKLKSHAVSREQITDAYRRLAAEHHPDRGGDAEVMADINAARDQGLEAIR